jgi:HK97 family phage prohead protease
MTMERRSLEAPFEFRAEADGTVKVAGYAAVFNQPADIGGVFTEVIERGAFRSALDRGDDVVFLVNHGGLPLARTTAGNLSLSEDSRGLRMEATLDGADPDVARIVPKLRNKLLTAMSFAFNVGPEDQRWGETGDGKSLRTIKNFSNIGDVSVVNTPAYEGTEIALRSRDASAEAAEGEREKAEHNAARARARIAARKAESEQKFRGIK